MIYFHVVSYISVLGWDRQPQNPPLKMTASMFWARQGNASLSLAEVLRLFQDLQDLLQEPSVIAFSTLAVLIKVDVLMNSKLH